VRGSVDSTNAEAMRLLPELNEPTWILGLEQTAGRGRRGRPWISPKGNFHATLVMRPVGPTAQVALRSFVAAVALREAFSQVTKLSHAFSLKWPNDVLLNGGKVAGILLESVGNGDRVEVLCIGIGVNLIAAPDALAIETGAVPPVSLLGETGTRVTPEGLLNVLAPAYARWEAVFAEQGFGAIRQEWLSYAARLGEVIRARTGTEIREGVFETIDLDGALVLAMAKGRVSIPAAEVFF
jgi:BirA family biotin operon repressor/biotin-[acetyl-CoA-carboxylase] ligase